MGLARSFNPGLLPTPHPQRGTRSAPLPRLTSGPFHPTGVPPALPEGLTMTPAKHRYRPWSHRNRPGPLLRPGTSGPYEAEGLSGSSGSSTRAGQEVPPPPLSGVDPTPRRGEETPDVLHQPLPRRRGRGGGGADLASAREGGGRRRRVAGRWGRGRLPIVAPARSRGRSGGVGGSAPSLWEVMGARVGLGGGSRPRTRRIREGSGLGRCSGGDRTVSASAPPRPFSFSLPGLGPAALFWKT